MCHQSCQDFAKARILPEEIRGRSVIEVGSRVVNGSVRPLVESFGPAYYLGVDILPGPGVDEICDSCDLVDAMARTPSTR